MSCFRDGRQLILRRSIMQLYDYDTQGLGDGSLRERTSGLTLKAIRLLYGSMVLVCNRRKSWQSLFYVLTSAP